MDHVYNLSSSYGAAARERLFSSVLIERMAFEIGRYCEIIRISWKYTRSVDIICILWKYPRSVDIISILWIYMYYVDTIRISWKYPCSVDIIIFFTGNGPRIQSIERLWSHNKRKNIFVRFQPIFVRSRPYFTLPD